MQLRNLILVAFVLLPCFGCTKSQAPVGELKSGGIVDGDSSDLPIYNETAGPQVSITVFPQDIQMMFKDQVEVTPYMEAYNEANGHYPVDYAEFKSGIIEPNNLTFPSKLPAGMQLQYDEAKHEVVVVRKKK